MSKVTHYSEAGANGLRVGGLAGFPQHGAQPVMPARVPSNWYPRNLPAASNGTPTNSDCQQLLNFLAPLVARLTIERSVLLALSYRTVQSGVKVQANAPFTVNGVTVNATSFFDSGINLSESVPVDVVNKNPSLAYDLAVRLAIRTALQIDYSVAGLYGSLTPAAVGTGHSGAISAATLTSAVSAIVGTGEPLFLVLLSDVQGYDPAVPTLPSDGSLTYYESLAYPGLGAATLNLAVPVRLLGSPAIAQSSSLSPTAHNLLITPSAFAFASADMGSVTGANPEITPSGTVLYEASVWKDPETATPQLALQLVIGNTGNGNQTVYVNMLGAAICVNPARGIVVQS